MEGFDRGDSRTAFGVSFGWDSNLLIICSAWLQRSFSRCTFRWEIAVVYDNFTDGCEEMFITLPSCHMRKAQSCIKWWNRCQWKMMNLNPSYSPHSVLSLMTGSQWTHIKWQANISPSPISSEFWIFFFFLFPSVFIISVIMGEQLGERATV